MGGILLCQKRFLIGMKFIRLRHASCSPSIVIDPAVLKGIARETCVDDKLIRINRSRMCVNRSLSNKKYLLTVLFAIASGHSPQQRLSYRLQIGFLISVRSS